MLRTASSVLLLALALPAQTTTKVVPANRATVEGTISAGPPWAMVTGRFQQIFDGAAIARATATINAISHRRDGNLRVSVRGRVIRNLKVSLGYTSRTPATMATSFARNRTGAQTVVFNGSFNLPAQIARRGVGPFNITVRATRPYQYRRAGGNLLLELEVPGTPSNRFFLYIIDAERSTAVRGGVRKFGTGGPFKSGDNYDVSSDATKLNPGGSAVLIASGLRRAYPAFGAFGFSNTQYGPFRLPLNLAGAGASGNHLYVSLDLLLLLPLRATGSTYGGNVAVPIPNNQAFGGITLYGQGIFFDPASNALKLVFSGGLAMTIAGNQAAPFQSVWHVNPASATGNRLVRGALAGPVTQLTGSFR